MTLAMPTKSVARVLVLNVSLLQNRKWLPRTHVYGIEIQILSTFGDKTKVCVVKSRNSNLHVDELRYRELQHFLDDVAHDCVQDRKPNKSTTRIGIQSEKSDDHHLLIY